MGSRRRVLVLWVMMGLVWAVLIGGQSEPGALANVADQPVPQVGETVRAAVAADGEVRVVIFLREPSAVRRSLPAQRRAVAQAQDNVLARLPAGTFTLLHRYQMVPGLARIVTPQSLQALAQHPLVATVYLDQQGTGHLGESGPALGADVARNSYGLTGKGITVAVLDSGVDTDHPDLSGAIVAQHCFTDNNCPPGNTAESTSAEDAHGHGTHVSGIIAARGIVSAPGFAPGAKIVAVRVLDAGNSGWLSDWSRGLDWVRVNLNTYNIRVVNMSLGSNARYTGSCQSADPVLAEAVQQLVAAGVTIFASSGNAASSTQLSAPACMPGVVAVGATYDGSLGRQPAFGTYSSGCFDTTSSLDMITCFTNSNEQLDILAPGARILAPYIGGGTATFVGTSMASPTAAGTAALMLQAQTTLTPAEIESILKTTGVSITDTRNGLSFPRIRVVNALAGLLRYGVRTTALAGQSALPGIQVSYTLPVSNTGNVNDTFDLLVAGNNWETTATASVGPLAAGDSASATVTVKIPAAALGRQSDTASVTIRSRGDPSQQTSVQLVTTAQPLYGLLASPPTGVLEGKPDTTVIHTLTITNTANTSDTFTLTLAGEWPASAASPTAPLNKGASLTIPVSVTIPPATPAGTAAPLTVTVRSQGDPTKAAQVVLNTRALPGYGLRIAANRLNQSAPPGTIVTYQMTISNTGNLSDTFDISISGNQWPSSLPTTAGPLERGNSSTFNVAVTLPTDTLGAASDTVTVTVRSRSDATLIRSVTLTTTHRLFQIYNPLVHFG